jgi:hypothetical protein
MGFEHRTILIFIKPEFDQLFLRHYLSNSLANKR